jgi:hypothetical protein
MGVRPGHLVSDREADHRVKPSDDARGAIAGMTTCNASQLYPGLSRSRSRSRKACAGSACATTRDANNAGRSVSSDVSGGDGAGGACGARQARHLRPTLFAPRLSQAAGRASAEHWNLAWKDPQEQELRMPEPDAATEMLRSLRRQDPASRLKTAFCPSLNPSKSLPWRARAEMRKRAMGSGADWVR